jgi:chemotaxis protein methyltransferase WspC
MILSEFENLLKQTMGLDSASIGSSSIKRAVQQRIGACSLESWQDYLEHLRGSKAELQELIEAVAVPETWFFRNSEAFAALGRLASEQWIPTSSGQTLRLLSVPCSTGEEPFSIAMTLLEANVPGERFKIDAVDITTRVLTQARIAVYGRNSFRGRNLSFRDKYFRLTPPGYELMELVRKQVNFQQGNLLGRDFLLGRQHYDVIFCRNLLIYFDRPNQDRAVKALSDLLTEKGLLFVGPSETGLMLRHGFTSTKWPLSFAFRKTSSVPAESINSAFQHPQSKTASSLPQAQRPIRTPKPDQLQQVKPIPKPQVRPVPEPAPAPESNLDAAGKLADQGRIAEALEICEAHLRQYGPSAKVFYLLGLIRDAAGSAKEASEYYRKALYLEPNHYEALMHMVFLADKVGNTTEVEVLQDRARRVKERVTK